MSEMVDPRDLDDSIARTRAAVLAAGFRKLRYRAAPDEIATLVAIGKSDQEVFDNIENQQDFFTKVAIRWRRFRRGRG
ncbi:MAG: hypothetical protein ABL956_07725 [Hyphomonadaceae bacterium]